MKNVMTYICTLTGHPCVGCRQDCENRAETDGDGDEVPAVGASGTEGAQAENGGGAR